jgi:hypothetical protein
MTSQQSEQRFEMGIPQVYKRGDQYGFWLTTTEKRLLTTVYAMRCVAGMKRHRPSGRVLVEISTDHDPDEAWHWIRSELEDAVNYVELDDIWEEAIKWIL